MSAGQAANRLGVKVETLYAYVSRGVISRHRSPSGRGSVFDPLEVEALARRGRPRRTTRPPAIEFAIETRLTAIGDHVIRYRGRNAATLARSATFEQVAELLWTGTLPEHPPRWNSNRPPVLPAPGTLVDQIRMAVPRAAVDDPLRGDLRTDAVVATGRALVAGLVESLPLRGESRTPGLVLAADGTSHPGTMAGRLWARLVRGRPRPGAVAVLNAALVLLADHELAASTLAARIAASTRADPYAVVMAGLGPLAGPLHGGASRAARRLLDEAAAPAGVEAALAEALRLHGAFPGFGHRLYADGDPRAAQLLEMLRRAAGASPAMVLVDRVLEGAERRVRTAPNVDFALAALGSVLSMPPEAGEVVFTVARCAGWLAHAIEEYGEDPLRFRPRARYVG